MQLRTTHSISTKKDKDSPERTTQLTLDWTGVTPELMQGIATRQIVVTLQGRFRNSDAPIPASYEFKVADYNSKVAEPVTVETTLARASALTPEEQKKLLAQLTANLAKAAAPPAQQPKK